MRRRSVANPPADHPPQLSGGRIPIAALIQTLAVAEHLSFHRAALALGTSQSSVSTHIKALAAELGILLFERNTRGVRLTEAGQQFVARVAVGIDQIDYAIKTANMAADGEYGRLRVGTPGLLPCSFFGELIARYRGAYPGIALEIMEATARDTITHLRADRIDVAFVAGAPELTDCHSRWISAGAPSRPGAAR
ncbi:LysR family transcriptional regulator [Croceicoccus bisphenolivorans]|uniref:LysR family transcriptional regulator n=1 Tax=Croceicoccus bisphenolivorans TaxID=1783232 RepID=UPI000830B0AD|nr:LysR family transcriptional regulator [Croceicoccus bisphenolivorans]